MTGDLLGCTINEFITSDQNMIHTPPPPHPPSFIKLDTATHYCFIYQHGAGFSYEMRDS